MTLLTVREAAQRLHISPRMMQRLIATGRIPVLDMGPRTRRIAEHDLEEYRAQHRRRVA